MQDKGVGVARDGAVATVTVSHPGKLNVLDPALMVALRAALASLAGDAGLRAVVLRGAGDRAFIGGADLRAMVGLDGPEAARDFITGLHLVCRAVRDLPVPVIARCSGWVLGAGLELAVSCDLRLADDTARFGMPEVRVGMPSVIEAALLPGLIGWGRTRRLLFLGETIGAAEAERWGLVERVVAPDALDAAVAEWVAMLLEAGPAAIRLQKRLHRRWEDSLVTAAIAAGVEAYADAFARDEPQRLIGAFLARRRPVSAAAAGGGGAGG